MHYAVQLEEPYIDLETVDDGIRALARIAAEVNNSVENIGARRLQTVMERLLETLSFEAEDRRGETLTELAFIDQRQKSAGDFTPEGAFVLQASGGRERPRLGVG